MHHALTLTLSVLASLLVACGSIASGPQAIIAEAPADAAAIATDEPVDADRIALGIEIYRANYCGTCHALDAARTHGNFGPRHDDAGMAAQDYIQLVSYSGQATNAADYIRESIVEPGIFTTPGFEATAHRMPAFSHLSDEDLDAMVYMLLHQVRQTSDS